MFLENHGYYKINDEHLSLFTQNSVAYVAGFVIKSLRRLSRTCKQCVQCLIESDADSIGEGITSLLRMKDCGGLIKPSKWCYMICMAAQNVCERVWGQPKCTIATVNADDHSHEHPPT